MVGIYKITNLINNKIYIGQSKNIEKRWAQHKKEYQRRDYVLYRAMRKDGIKNFKFEVLEECLVAELDEKEYNFIISLNTIVPEGYNVSWDTRTNTLLLKEIKNLQKEIIQDKVLMQDLAKKYNLSPRTITAINMGDSWYREDLQYPLRPNKKVKPCPKCKKEINIHSNQCKSCADLALRKVERPSPEQLTQELKEGSFIKVAKKYGVSDTAIRKWCKSYGLSSKAADYK